MMPVASVARDGAVMVSVSLNVWCFVSVLLSMYAISGMAVSLSLVSLARNVFFTT